MITIEVKGGDKIHFAIQNLNKELEDFTLPLKMASDKYLNAVDQNYNSQGKTFSSPWAKRKYQYPWRPLNKTGKMKGGFDYKLEKIQSNVYNKIDYFKYHQLGTKNLPTRTMLKMDYKRGEEIKRIFVKWLNEVSPQFKK